MSSHTLVTDYFIIHGYLLNKAKYDIFRSESETFLGVEEKYQIASHVVESVGADCTFSATKRRFCKKSEDRFNGDLSMI